MTVMDQGLEKARQFARTRYTGELEQIVREHEQKRLQMRAQLNQRGLLMSGNMIAESARSLLRFLQPPRALESQRF